MMDALTLFPARLSATKTQFSTRLWATKTQFYYGSRHINRLGMYFKNLFKDFKS